jgi:hypothetical protein
MASSCLFESGRFGADNRDGLPDLGLELPGNIQPLADAHYGRILSHAFATRISSSPFF